MKGQTCEVWPYRCRRRELREVDFTSHDVLLGCAKHRSALQLKLSCEPETGSRMSPIYQDSKNSI